MINRLLLLFVAISFALWSCGDESSEEATEDAQDSRQVATLTEAQAQDLAIDIYKVERKRHEYNLACPGIVHPAPGNISIVSAPVGGIVEKIYYNEGQKVSKGQALAVINSLEYANMLNDYLSSRNEMYYLRQELKRLKKMVDQKIAPESDYAKLKLKYDVSKTTAQNAQIKLIAVGVSKSQIEKWNEKIENNKENVTSEEFEISSKLYLRAGISGTINKSSVVLGQAVQLYDEMFSIISSNQVLIKGYIAPDDAVNISAGDSLLINNKKQSQSKYLYSTISSINPALDETNKAIIINTILSPKDNWPLPGENVRLEVITQTIGETIAIPVSAIAYEGERTICFVEIDKNVYEKRYIDVAKMTENIAIIKSGLTEGEKIAASQVFTLKSLTKFEEFAE